MISNNEIQALLDSGGTVVDADGSKIGSIGQVFLDDQTGTPEWVTVRTGLFGGGESFVPLAEAAVSDGDIRVPFSKSKVKDAPRVDDSEGHLSQDQEAELYRFYGLAYGDGVSDSGVPANDAPRDDRPDYSGDPDVVGADTSGPTTDHAMTRSEQRLHVGTENVVTGKARLRKYVVTENVTQTVPVSHEEVRLEREPITDANQDSARAGQDLSSEEHEITLNEERIVTSKETVPVERVKLDTETVTTEQTVQEQVGKEQIELDDSEVPSGRGPTR